MIDGIVQPWRERRLWPSLAHVVLDLPVGLVLSLPSYVLFGSMLATALLLPLAVVLFVLLLLFTQVAAMVERSRASALLDVDLVDPVPPLPPGAPWKKLRAAATSWARWKQIGYAMVRLPLSVVLGGIVVGAWSMSLAALALPAYVGALPRDTAQLGIAGASAGAGAWLACLLGLAGIVVVAPWLTVTAAAVDRWLATRLLSPGADQVLAARAAKAETGRAAAVDAAEAERRRIERDLHDGAQQRLVALAVDLGAARERFDTDPEGAKALVAEAHEEAKAALREIRDLVRGIHPVILEDRGLDAALSAVVARSPVPVELKVDLDRTRLGDSVESAAYFVVSEALANVARHSNATRAHVGIVTSGDNLIVEVRDDGIGGADPSIGTGLRGLRDRVLALGGTLDLLSPVGGPTTVLVELPCAS